MATKEVANIGAIAEQSAGVRELPLLADDSDLHVDTDTTNLVLHCGGHAVANDDHNVAGPCSQAH
ncbi:hypothetical protein [Bradyrhizobium sp. Rc2d]|uniref:hypothetical protein n=1 Tax=Bradyrhizobium sp. Rc2d TaxID=1855321 RepID=UPI000B881D08|nr:hypothetical protein [Bradyrhizobium sp. Rc2d]